MPENNKDYCQNCNSRLMGEYCHQCGQQQVRQHRFFGTAILDLLGSLFSYDSQVNRTLKPLLFKPGFLSNEYIAGRRARYILPFRLYLFASVICFLLLSLNNSFLSYSVEPDVNGNVSQQPTIPTSLVTVDESSDGLIGINIDLPEELQEYEQLLERQLLKLSRLSAQEQINLVLATMPKLMLVLLPLLALLLKLLYMRSGFYYVDHLVVILHGQSFLFLLLSLSNLSTAILSWLPLSTATMSGWISFILGSWMFIYTPLMLRRVYQQSKTITALKYLVIGLSYTALSLLALVIAFLWNVVTL